MTEQNDHNNVNNNNKVNEVKEDKEPSKFWNAAWYITKRVGIGIVVGIIAGTTTALLNSSSKS